MLAFLPSHPHSLISPSPILGAKRLCRRRCAPLRPPRSRRIQTTMIEQNTITIVATMLAGIGGGIALVAWTEAQGKGTELRENTQPCAECQGETTTTCNVCNGSKEDPLDASKACAYCDGRGSIKCFNCAGSGIQPRFLDRLSPEDFMD